MFLAGLTDTRTVFLSDSEGRSPNNRRFDGEPPELPKTQPEGNLSDSRLIWTFARISCRATPILVPPTSASAL